MDDMRNALGGNNRGNGGRNNFAGNGNRAQVGNGNRAKSGNGAATRSRSNGNGYGAPQAGPALASYRSG